MRINSDLLRRLRIENGLSLKAAAARLNISEATLSRYECAQINRPAPDVLIACSKLYRVPLNVLYDEPEPEWVSALQEAGLKDPRVANFIQYLNEQAEKEMNSDAFSMSDEERDIIIAYRDADEKTREIVQFALGLNKKDDM
jgi:transcriptional regulator with XRE-family HTH domain